MREGIRGREEVREGMAERESTLHVIVLCERVLCMTLYPVPHLFCPH